MGYKKSFNLVTLQLIIPLSTMTKAEYKNTYGIDLDDIDIEKVTLLQEDESKNKYFVEEVKTTENGIDIYAGGNILSIGSSVSVVKNAYSVINSKPIYCHPILLYYTVSSSVATPQARVNFLIFNNVKDAYTKTNAIAMIKNLLDIGAIIECSGYYVEDSKSKPAILMVKRTTAPIYSLLVNNLDGTESYKDIDNLGFLFDVTDGVNKIN